MGNSLPSLAINLTRGGLIGIRHLFHRSEGQFAAMVISNSTCGRRSMLLLSISTLSRLSAIQITCVVLERTHGLDSRCDRFELGLGLLSVPMVSVDRRSVRVSH